MTYDVQLATPEHTRAYGRALAGLLQPGDLLVMDGPLGAGKTALTQGLGEGLGVRGSVTSPTFVLARLHPGPLPLLHVDAYRVREQGPVALEGLDLELALEDGVVVVEWGAGLVEHLSSSWLTLELSRPEESAVAVRPDEPDITPRVLRIQPHGPRWAAVQLP